MGDSVIKKIVSWLLLLSVFITGSGVTKIGFTIEWFHFIYIPFAIFGLIAFHRFSYRIGIFLIALTIWSLLTFKMGLPLVFKQIFNITFSAFVFYNYLLFENFNLSEIFNKYISVAKIVLIIGFFQMFIFAFEPYGFPAAKIFKSIFPFLKDAAVEMRFQSVAQEPSYIAYAFAPIVFIGMYNLFYNRKFFINWTWSIFFIFSYLLTFSVVAYVGLVIIVLVVYFRNFTINKLAISVFVFATIGLLTQLAYKTIPAIKMRMDDTVFGANSDFTDPRVYRSVNLTTYVLLSHKIVTAQAVKTNPILGTGLGTYELVYDEYIPPLMKVYSQLNREDAGNMTFRLLVEAGVVGFLFFCFFVFRFKMKWHSQYSENQEIYWIMNAGIFVMILLFLLRSGNYTHQARVLFFLIYYYTFQAAKDE